MIKDQIADHLRKLGHTESFIKLTMIGGHWVVSKTFVNRLVWICPRHFTSTS